MQATLEWAETAAQYSVVGNPPAIIRGGRGDEYAATLARLTRERLKEAEREKKMEDLAERQRSKAEWTERNRQRLDWEAQTASADKQLRGAMQSHLATREAVRNEALPLGDKPWGEKYPERLGSNSSRQIKRRSSAARLVPVVRA